MLVRMVLDDRALVIKIVSSDEFNEILTSDSETFFDFIIVVEKLYRE